MREPHIKEMLVEALLEGLQVGEMWALQGRDPSPEYRKALAERAVDRLLARYGAAK